MTHIVDYGTLKDALKGDYGYFHRNDLDGYVDVFIDSARTKINRSVKSRFMEVEAVITSASENFILPTDFAEMRSVYIGDKELLSQLTPNQMNSCSLSHEPSFTIIDNTLKLRPEPTVNTDVNITYYKDFPRFKYDSSSNPLLRSYPMVYVYGAMVEFSIYTQNDGRLQVWTTMFANEVSDINKQTRDLLYSGTPLSIRTF